MSILFFENDLGPCVSLVDALREIHEERASETRAAIKRRQERNVPLDDNASKSTLDALCIDMRGDISKMDFVGVRSKARAILDETNGTLEEPSEFVAPDYCEGVVIQPRAMSELRRQQLAVAHDKAYEIKETTKDNRDTERFLIARCEYVANSLAKLEGLSRADGSVFDFKKDESGNYLDAQALRAIAGHPLLDLLFSVCLYWQRLPAKKAVRFGLPQP